MKSQRKFYIEEQNQSVIKNENRIPFNWKEFYVHKTRKKIIKKEWLKIK